MTLATGPVEKLVKLISDESRVDERSSTPKRSNLVKKRVSESLAQHYISTREPRIQCRRSYERKQSYERLLQALQDMKMRSPRRFGRWRSRSPSQRRSSAQTFSQRGQPVEQVLEEIDDNILACRHYLQDTSASDRVSTAKRKAHPTRRRSVRSRGLPTTDLGEIVRERAKILRLQGKI